MVIVSQYILIINLNVNGLNSPITRHRGAELIIIIIIPYYMIFKRDSLQLYSALQTHKLKVKGWKKIFHANRKQKMQG